MPRATPEAVSRELRAVFEGGTVSGLTDLELLERFRGRRDDGASFEAIVARHGPMVLGVCRDILGDHHSADDAFQATFLVLVKRASAVRLGAGESLGRWLHGVAWRVARHARSDVARRRRREGGAERHEVADDAPPAGEVADRADLRALLHDELNRLPSAYRSALVLCHLDGLSHEEAARTLRWPVGTVRSRLARGRERLRGRLVRRGVAPAVALAAVETQGASAAVPTRLAVETVSAAVRVSASSLSASVLPATVLVLTEGVLLTMTLTKVKLVAAGLVAVASLAFVATSARALQDLPKAGTGPVASPPRVPSTPTSSAIAPKAPARDPFGATRATSSNSDQPPALDPLFAPFAPMVPSARELSARCQAAAEVYEQRSALYKQGGVSSLEVTEANKELEVAIGQIEALTERFRDELDLLQVRLERAQAEVQRARGLRGMAASEVAKFHRLNERIKGAVSEDDFSQSEGALRVADSELMAREADVKEIRLRIEHARRKLDALVKVLDAAQKSRASTRPKP